MLEDGKRDNTIDIVKGIGIILVVIGHTYGPLTHFIYLFHMAIFFIASGYCYSFKYSESISGIVTLAKKRIKSLWLPYFVSNCAFILLNNVFLKIQFYTDNPGILTVNNIDWGQTLGHYHTAKETASKLFHAFLFNQSTQLTGATWFLEALFFTTMIFAVIDLSLGRVIKKSNRTKWILHLCIAASTLLLGSMQSRFPILSKYRLGTILITVPVFEMGILFRCLTTKKIIKNRYYIIGMVCSIVLLIVSGQYGSIELATHTYTNIFYFLVVSFLGWMLVYGLSKIISNSSKTSLKKMLMFYGRNTIPILIFHLAFFKPVTFFIIVIRGLPSYLLACFPVLTSNGVWWIVYALTDIIMCTILIVIWNKVKLTIWKKESNK